MKVDCLLFVQFWGVVADFEEIVCSRAGSHPRDEVGEVVDHLCDIFVHVDVYETSCGVIDNHAEIVVLYGADSGFEAVTVFV